MLWAGRRKLWGDGSGPPSGRGSPGAHPARVPRVPRVPHVPPSEAVLRFEGEITPAYARPFVSETTFAFLSHGYSLLRAPRSLQRECL